MTYLKFLDFASRASKSQFLIKKEKFLDLLSIGLNDSESPMKYGSKILTLLEMRAVFLYRVKKQRYLKNRRFP